LSKLILIIEEYFSLNVNLSEKVLEEILDIWIVCLNDILFVVVREKEGVL